MGVNTMVDKKTKSTNDSSNKSLYRKTFIKTSPLGDFQGETTFDLQPWTMTSKNGKVSSGYSMRVRVKKAGFGKEGDENYKEPTDFSLSIDLGNNEIREALREAIGVVESQ
jgi:hypothetical protein